MLTVQGKSCLNMYRDWSGREGLIHCSMTNYPCELETGDSCDGMEVYPVVSPIMTPESGGLASNLSSAIDKIDMKAHTISVCDCAWRLPDTCRACRAEER
jgi:hypothetical protein